MSINEQKLADMESIEKAAIAEVSVLRREEILKSASEEQWDSEEDGEKE